MASYNDDPIQDHIREFMDITESSKDNGDGNDVEVDSESHVKCRNKHLRWPKIRKRASKIGLHLIQPT